MQIDLSRQLSEMIDSAIDKRIQMLPASYPCQVVSVDGVFVNVKTLLKSGINDIERRIPIIQSPYLTLPISAGDIGIALNCSYLFENILDGQEIQTNIKSQKENGLFFIPLVAGANQKNDTDSTTITNQNKDASIVLSSNGITIENAKKITFNNKINIDNLYSVISIVIEMIDLLANGVNGSASTNALYTAGKQAKITQIKTLMES